MTDLTPPAGDDQSPPFRTVPHEPPGGGCGCGPTGCLTAFVALFVVLLAIMVGIALFRPWVRGVVP